MREKYTWHIEVNYDADDSIIQYMKEHIPYLKGGGSFNNRRLMLTNTDDAMRIRMNFDEYISKIEKVEQ